MTDQDFEKSARDAAIEWVRGNIKIGNIDWGKVTNRDFVAGATWARDLSRREIEDLKKQIKTLERISLAQDSADATSYVLNSKIKIGRDTYKALVEKLAEALEFYERKDKYYVDCGNTARKALAHYEKTIKEMGE